MTDKNLRETLGAMWYTEPERILQATIDRIKAAIAKDQYEEKTEPNRTG